MHKKREALNYLIVALCCLVIGVPWFFNGTPIIGILFTITALSLLGDATRSYREYRTYIHAFMTELGKQHAMMVAKQKTEKREPEPEPKPAKTTYTVDELREHFGDAEIRVAGTKLGTVNELNGG